MFRRKIYTDVVEWGDSGRMTSLLIEGARQVGKTYIIREFGKRYDSFIELNFEEHPEYKLMFSRSHDSESVLIRMKNTFGAERFIPGNTLIFFDEVQLCPQAWSSMKSFAQNPDYAVVGSGSFLGLMYRDEAFSPGGYIETLRMDSMDLEEFAWANGISEETTNDIRASIRNKEPFDEYTLDMMEQLHISYVLTGGLPGPVSEFVRSHNIAKVREVTGHIRDIYRSDVVKYSDPKNRDDIFATFDSIPRQLAREDNRFYYNDIAVSSDDDGEEEGPARNRARSRVYRKAIEWLKDSGVCMRCHRVTDTQLPLTGDQRLFKLYVCDTGVLTSMISYDSVVPAFLRDDLTANRGYIMENCVADFINKAGLELMYYRKKDTEVDFITSLDGAVTGIEVKSGNNNMSKSLQSLVDRGLIQRAIKFETCNIFTDDKGVEHYPRFVSGFMDALFERTEYIIDPIWLKTDSGNRE